MVHSNISEKRKTHVLYILSSSYTAIDQPLLDDGPPNVLLFIIVATLTHFVYPSSFHPLSFSLV